MKSDINDIEAKLKALIERCQAEELPMIEGHLKTIQKIRREIQVMNRIILTVVMLSLFYLMNWAIDALVEYDAALAMLLAADLLILTMVIVISTSKSPPSKPER